MQSRHNAEVARIVRMRPGTRLGSCAWCGSAIELLSGDVAAERTLAIGGARVRPDITFLADDGDPAGYVEVIDTSPPRPDAVDAYLGVEAQCVVVLVVPRGYYCSMYCWVHRKDARFVPLTRRSCDSCGTLDLRDGAFTDYDNAEELNCLMCAAGHPGRPAIHPNGPWEGDYEAWEPREVLDVLPSDLTVAERYLALSYTEFWAKVWEGRVKYPTRERRGDESATRDQLDVVGILMETENWAEAFETLQTIGFNPLTAFRPENCARVSAAWNALREWRLNQLPGPVIEVIRQRGFDQDYSYARDKWEREQDEIE